MIKDYTTFREIVKEAVELANKSGKNLVCKRWQKKSVYQKNRYKPEYIFPEVWIYNNSVFSSSLGLVVNGEEVEDVSKLYKQIIEVF